MLRILVIFTGGTIGSSADDAYISTDAKKPGKLLDAYLETHPEPLALETLSPYTMLSENMTGTDLCRLAGFVAKHTAPDYDGIIITHGTDTLQYSAAMLGYYLQDSPVPLFLVSSNYVLEDPRSNGLANFAGAVACIRQRIGSGVFVPYRNKDGVTYIHRATRLLAHQAFTDEVYSIHNRFFGTLTADERFVPNPDYNALPGSALPFVLPGSWDSGILRIFPYPGMRYPAPPLPDDGTKAILLDTYHSGTLCGISPDLQPFFIAAYERHIPVFLTGAERGPSYESTKRWEHLHIHALPPASPIAMYCKLWLLLGANKNADALASLLCTPAGEDFFSDLPLR